MLLEVLEMNHAGEQEAALRVLKTVVPCTVRSKHKDKTPFRYCMQTSAGLYLNKSLVLKFVFWSISLILRRFCLWS